jgi:uncharacterized protein (TIGR02147 family)
LKNSIFDYQDYKKYLKDLIHSRPKHGHGVRSKLADAIGCQVAYVSQILNGGIDLNIEQTIRLNKFFGHTKEEAHFMLLLVQFARAGDRDTRDYFREQMEVEIAKRLVIKNRLGLAQGLSAEDQVTYYSTWYYAAVHILLTIPDFRTKPAIAEKLGLTLEKTNEVLEFLVRTGLANQEGNIFGTGQSQIHLGNDSKLIARHHANWRLRALDSLDQETKEDLHYSSVVSLSVSDIAKVKALAVKKIEEIISVVKDSKEEELAVFCVDFFRL